MASENKWPLVEHGSTPHIAANSLFARNAYGDIHLELSNVFDDSYLACALATLYENRCKVVFFTDALPIYNLAQCVSTDLCCQSLQQLFGGTIMTSTHRQAMCLGVVHKLCKYE